MDQILTITILDYFKTVHKIQIDTSNAIELLNTLKEFEAIHKGNKPTYTYYRGLDYNIISEFIIQDIHRIENLHKEYVNKGYLLTKNTKQYTVENKVKTNIRQMVNEVITEISIPVSNNKGNTTIEEIRLNSTKNALNKVKKGK